MNKSVILTLVTGVLFSAHSTISFAQMQEFQKLPARDAAIEKYIADNKIQNVKGSPDGFYYVIEKEGAGAFPEIGKEVFVHYVGTRLDGKKFDSSRDRGQPFSFPLGQGRVIKGWDKGIPLFREGSRGKLFLPPSVAYGERGAGGEIPANTPLVFDIEVFGGGDLAKIKENAAAEAAKAAAAAKAAEAAAAVAEPAKVAEYIKSFPAKVFKQADGMFVAIENEGAGVKPKTGDNVVFHFAGKFLDGRELGDSRAKNGSPLTITVGQNQMLPGGGFDKAFQMMGKGGKGTFVMPSAVALGAQSAQNIPAYTPFVFELEVVDVIDAVAAAAAAAAKIEPMKRAQQVEIEAYAKTNNLTIKTLPSGLSYAVEAQGTGAKVVVGKPVSVHYTGKLLNGTKFDSSRDKGEPIKFPIGVGQVIRGWDEGIPLFNVGGKGKLLIPSYLGYGEQGSPPNIPANSILVFDIEVMGVE